MRGRVAERLRNGLHRRKRASRRVGSATSREISRTFVVLLRGPAVEPRREACFQQRRVRHGVPQRAETHPVSERGVERERQRQRRGVLLLVVRNPARDGEQGLEPGQRARERVVRREPRGGGGDELSGGDAERQTRRRREKDTEQRARRRRKRREQKTQERRAVDVRKHRRERRRRARLARKVLLLYLCGMFPRELCLSSPHGRERPAALTRGALRRRHRRRGGHLAVVVVFLRRRLF